MARRRSIAFLADNNMEESVVEFLLMRGHDVIRVRDVMASNSTDPVVAEAAMQGNRVLLSWDKDFHHQRFLSERFRLLSRIGFSCRHREAVVRLKSVIALVESEHQRSTLAKPMVIKIGVDKIQIGR